MLLESLKLGVPIMYPPLQPALYFPFKDSTEAVNATPAHFVTQQPRESDQA